MADVRLKIFITPPPEPPLDKKHYFCANGHIMADVVRPEMLREINRWSEAYGNWCGEAPQAGGEWPRCRHCGALPENAHLHGVREAS